MLLQRFDLKKLFLESINHKYNYNELNYEYILFIFKSLLIVNIIKAKYQHSYEIFFYLLHSKGFQYS